VGRAVVWLDDSLTYKLQLTNAAESQTYFLQDNVDPSTFVGFIIYPAGQGDQNLSTTDSPTFAGMTLTGALSGVSGTFSSTLAAQTITTTGNATVGGDIIVTGTVDGVDIATLKTDVDAFPDGLQSLSADEVTQLLNINSTTISTTQWDYLGELNQALKVTDDVQFNDLTLTGDIAVAGTVDGADIASMRSDVDALQTEIALFDDGLQDLTAAEVQQLQNIDSATISTAQWVYVGDLDQALTTTSAVTFSSINGVTYSPGGAAVGQALGFPNSAGTVEPYTPVGAGDLLSTANLSELTNTTTAITNLGLDTLVLDDYDSISAAIAAGAGLREKFLTRGRSSGLYIQDSSDRSADLVVNSQTTTSINSGSEVITLTGHGYRTGDGMTPDTTVNGLTAGTVYWIRRIDDDTFNLHTTISAAYGVSAAVNLTGTTNFDVELLADPLGAVYLVPDNLNANGSEGVWVRSYEEGTVSAWWFGATGDGSTDDTAAVRAACRFTNHIASSDLDIGAVLRLGAGQYLVTDEITGDLAATSGWIIEGEGRRATTLTIDTATKDLICFYGNKENSGGVIRGCGVRSITLECSVADVSHTPSAAGRDQGALINFYWINEGFANDIEFKGGYRNLLLQRVANPFFGSQLYHHHGSRTSNGYSLLEMRSDSNTGAAADDDQSNTTTHIERMEAAMGQYSSNSSMEHGILILSVDGAWFDNCHIQGANKDFVISPNSDVVGASDNPEDRIFSVRCDNCYFDNGGSHGVLLEGTAEDDQYRMIHFNGGEVHDVTDGVVVNTTTTLEDLRIGFDAVRNIDNWGVEMANANSKNTRIDVGYFRACNSAGVADGGEIKVDGDAVTVQVWSEPEASTTAGNVVNVASSATDVDIQFPRATAAGRTTTLSQNAGWSEIKRLIIDQGFDYRRPQEATIASGAITATQEHIELTAESGGVDDLDTVNGVPIGGVVYLRANPGNVITAKDSTGNLRPNNSTDFVMDTRRDVIAFERQADGNLYELFRNTPTVIDASSFDLTAGATADFSPNINAPIPGYDVGAESGTTDDVYFIDGSNVSDGQLVRFRAAPGDTITFNHGSTSGGDTYTDTLDNVDGTNDLLRFDAHSITTGDAMEVSADAYGLTAGTTYYLNVSSANFVSVHLSRGQALTDTSPVNLTGPIGTPPTFTFYPYENIVLSGGGTYAVSEDDCIIFEKRSGTGQSIFYEVSRSG
jgi:hypothetical protein